MTTEEILRDIRTILAASQGSAALPDLTLDMSLRDCGIVYSEWAGKLHLAREGTEAATLHDLAAAVTAAHAEDALRHQAAVARIQRLVGAVLASTQQAPASFDFSGWWTELVAQTIWWQFAERVNGGKELVLADVPADAASTLLKTGACDLDRLLSEPERSRTTIIDLLQRFGMTGDEAAAVFAHLRVVAANIQDAEGGVLQRIIRRHADDMANAVAEQLAKDGPDQELLERAVRAWLSAMTRLPILVWSPSTIDFVEKFRDVGVDEEELTEVGSATGIDFIGIDQALSQFMLSICEPCSRSDPNQRLCLKKLAEIGWESECVDPANID